MPSQWEAVTRPTIVETRNWRVSISLGIHGHSLQREG